jgi:hypothetical protein
VCLLLFYFLHECCCHRAASTASLSSGHLTTCSSSFRSAGRFGRKGVAINFVKNDDIRILRDIEQYYGTQIDEMPMNGERCTFFCLVCSCGGFVFLSRPVRASTVSPVACSALTACCVILALFSAMQSPTSSERRDVGARLLEKE